MQRHLSNFGEEVLITMDSKAESYAAIVLGVVIILADVFWLLVGQSYTYAPWLAAGIVIFIAALVWIWIDFDLMKKSK